MKRFFLALVVAALAGGSVKADTTNVVFGGGFNNGGLVPDANFGGWADTRIVNLGDFGNENMIDSLQVSISISGGFNGDLYGYLVHSSGFSVLFNRTGKSGSDAFGYGDGGFNITLDDNALNGNIHFYQNTLIPPGNGALTGTWAPDGRNVDPLAVNGLETPNATLSSFVGLLPNGSWTLFLSDLSVGGESTVTGWTLHMSTTAVPEPSTVALIGVGLAACWGLRRRRV